MLHIPLLSSPLSFSVPSSPHTNSEAEVKWACAICVCVSLCARTHVRQWDEWAGVGCVTAENHG